MPGEGGRPSVHWGQPLLRLAALYAGNQHVYGGGQLDLLEEHAAPGGPGDTGLGRSPQQGLGVVESPSSLLLSCFSRVQLCATP